MNSEHFVSALAAVQLDSVFNPYSDCCGDSDSQKSPGIRRSNLKSYLEAIEKQGVQDVWMGRDLGYRGGRRTGIAFTDEAHLANLMQVYSGCYAVKATLGKAMKERTANEIWRFLEAILNPPLLWNVFPLHPHELTSNFTNRKFTAGELDVVTEINMSLISWLKPRRIVAVGQDAAKYAQKLGLTTVTVRHPSYGGTAEFRSGITTLYQKQFRAIALM